jgi:transketolase
MRKAFAETLIEVAEENPRVIFLTGDLGFQVFDEFKEKFGPRYVNVGVAEAEMVLAAAGLAFEGWRPIAYSIASFATGRAFEQIRISVNYPDLPVVIVGAGGAFTYSKSGITHHAVEDAALMSLLSNMTVVLPGDPNEVKELFPQLFKIKGPSYIRIGRYGEPEYKSDSPIILGKGRLLKDGEKVAIVSTGDMAVAALEACTELKSENIFPMIMQFHTVKPLDVSLLSKVSENVDTIIIAEEQSPWGGLNSAINNWKNEAEKDVKIIRLGPPDKLALGNLKRDELRLRMGYNPESIFKVCKKAWGKT